jgi:hypothetical protein
VKRPDGGRMTLVVLKPGETGWSATDPLVEACIDPTDPLLPIGSYVDLLPVRRADATKRNSCDIITGMNSAAPEGDTRSDATTAPVLPDGLSAFIARVLNQLSLSAWLPAAFLTANIAVLLQLRSARSASVLRAVQELTNNPVQVLVILIPLLIIVTVVTQAFAFEAIRGLEGYWNGRGPIGVIRTVMIMRQVRRRTAVRDRLKKEYRKAVHSAMADMIINGVPYPVAKAIEARFSDEGAEVPQLSDEQRDLLAHTNWRFWCKAWRLAKIDNLIKEELVYPESSRIMPTRLGNLMRATEDELMPAGGDIQGFVLRRRELVSSRIQMQHDSFRTRLEMYCTLVFVSALLAALAPAVLVGHVGVGATTIAFSLFTAMSMASYSAALASARGYCAMLKQMAEASSELHGE